MDTKSKRAASIGHGRRLSSISATSHSPSPALYKIPSTFSKTPKSNAYTFGMSREFFRKVYLKENPPRDKNVPGPGAYEQKSEKSQIKYSIRPKTAVHSAFQNYTKGYPGPGTYEMSKTDIRNGK